MSHGENPLDWRRDANVRGVRPLAVISSCLSLVVGCGGEPATPFPCATPDPAAQVEVNGAYRYSSSSSRYHLRGTITFAQAGSRVEVTDTHYDNARDRAVGGAADLLGNRYDVTMTPLNGDTNYTAQVSFVFGDGGKNFCLLGFTDTNGDTGGLASYFGFRE